MPTGKLTCPCVLPPTHSLSTLAIHIRKRQRGRGRQLGVAARMGQTIGRLPHSHRPSRMPTDLLALPSAGQPPSHHPPACPVPSPICDLSPICPLHASSHHMCPSVHASYLPPSPSILPASCPQFMGLGISLGRPPPSPHHLAL